MATPTPTPQKSKLPLIIGLVVAVIALIVIALKSKSTATAAANTDVTDPNKDASTPIDTGTSSSQSTPIGPYPKRCISANDTVIKKGRERFSDADGKANISAVHSFFDVIKVNYSKTPVALGFMKGLDIAVTSRNLTDLRDEFILYMQKGKAYKYEDVKLGEFICDAKQNPSLSGRNLYFTTSL